MRGSLSPSTCWKVQFASRAVEVRFPVIVVVFVRGVREVGDIVTRAALSTAAAIEIDSQATVLVCL